MATTTAPESTFITWTAAVTAWIVAVPMYSVSKFASVVAHEGGHALVARLLSQPVMSIRFDRHGGGVTATRADPPWLAQVPIALAGYLGPSLFGLLAAWLLIRGAAVMVLWASVAFLTIMLLVVRGLLGWLLVPVLMAAILWVALTVEDPLQTWLTYVWVWFLLIAGVQEMLLLMTTKAYKVDASDPAQLRRLTLLPSAAWAFLLLAGTVAALVYGGVMLLGIAHP